MGSDEEVGRYLGLWQGDACRHKRTKESLNHTEKCPWNQEDGDARTILRK